MIKILFLCHGNIQRAPACHPHGISSSGDAIRAISHRIILKRRGYDRAIKKKRLSISVQTARGCQDHSEHSKKAAF